MFKNNHRPSQNKGRSMKLGSKRRSRGGTYVALRAVLLTVAALACLGVSQASAKQQVSTLRLSHAFKANHQSAKHASLHGRTLYMDGRALGSDGSFKTNARAHVTTKTALLNSDSVTTGDGITDSSGNPISLEQFVAQKLGYTVTVVDGATWDAMTAAQFAAFNLLIIGDPFCSDTAASAISNASTWAPVVMGNAGGATVTGNRVLISTDPEFHFANGGGGAQPQTPGDPSTAGAEHLDEAGMSFAGQQTGATNLFFDTSCADPGGGAQGSGDIAVLDQLTTTGPGHWTEDPSPPCGGSVQKIAANAAFNIVSDTDIQGWSCSDHQTWPAFPTDWDAVAVATDTATHPTCGTDPSTGTTACGEAYVLVSGSGVVVTAPDLSLSPTSATNPVGTSHTVTATVTQSGSPVSGAKVLFAIGSGPNTGATLTCTLTGGAADPGCTTGSDGKVNGTYTDTGGAGTDTINASVTLSGSTEHATASKTWTSSTPGGPTVVNSGFSCQVAVGTGPTDATASVFRTTDSVEFFLPYTQGGASFDSVTTNCVGKLPAGTVHSTTGPVSHSVVCRQFDPFDKTKPTIAGAGTTTTYPDGLYSETCNTPDYPAPTT